MQHPQCLQAMAFIHLLQCAQYPKVQRLDDVVVNEELHYSRWGLILTMKHQRKIE
jgi:hypothetical protein